MDFALKNASKSCIAFSLKNLFTSFYHTICDFKKKILRQKISKLDVQEKIEAKFAFSTKNYYEDDISYSMNT